MLSTRHLGIPKSPWVVLSPCAPDTLRMVVEHEFPRLFVAVLSGKSCRTTRGVFRAFSKQLKFPDYFGQNWDAFEECVNDLSWLHADGFLVIVSDAEALLARDDEAYETFIDIMTDAGQQWAKRARGSRPFHVVLATSSRAVLAQRRWRVRPTALALCPS